MQLMARCQRLAFGSISTGTQLQYFSVWDSPHGTLKCHEATRPRTASDARARAKPSHSCGRRVPFVSLHLERAATLFVVAYRKQAALESKYLSAWKSLSERQPEGFGI